VEVRSRSTERYGPPEASVTFSKQKRLVRLAQVYLKKHKLERRPARFDVVAITWKSGVPEVKWFANAFEARY
jgi:putative endonuclease